MLPLLNLLAISKSQIADHPFPWVCILDTFSNPHDALLLADTFPADGFTTISRIGPDKSYQLHGRRLDSTSLPNIWQKLNAELSSTVYRQAVEECTGQSLNGLDMEMTLWRQPSGGFLGPHTDKSDKVISHVFYFSNLDWSFEDGGCIRILRSQNINDIDVEIPPHTGTSLLFVRTDQSWHGYTPIQVGRGDRCSLQVIFHRPTLGYTSELSVHETIDAPILANTPGKSS
jgi:SM-20-related protein